MNIREMYEAGLSLEDAAARLGVNKEAVRGRARRAGIRWTEIAYAAHSPWEKMSDRQRLDRLKDGERRLLVALAHAIARGEHTPQAMKAAA